MGGQKHVCLVYLVLLLVTFDLTAAGRSPEDLPILSSQKSSTDMQQVQQQSEPLLVATHSERLSGQQDAAIADVDDENANVAPAAFGDYYYHDKLEKTQTDRPQDLSAASDDGEHVGLGGTLSQEQRQAYLVEDGSGRLSVVEQEASSLPDGGHITWQRTTGPNGVMLTTVATSSSSDYTSGSLQAVLDRLPSSGSSNRGSYLPLSMSHFMPHLNVFSSAVNSALAPINQLLDALTSQQQQLTMMMMPMPLELAADQQQMPPHPPHMMFHRKHGPCRKHSAVVAAAAAAARRQQQQQPEAAIPEIGQLIGAEQQQLADFAERFGVLPEAELVRLSQELQLKEILEENGLALSDAGNVIPLDEAKKWEAVAAAPDQPDLEDLYLEYVDPAQETADFVDSAYETVDDSDGDYYASNMDYDLDAAALGDYSQLLASFLEGLRRNMSDAGVGLDNMRQWVNVDALLLLLLVGGTVGMCVLFLHNLMQLRPMLTSGSSIGVAALPLKAMAPIPVVVAAANAAAGLKSGSRRTPSEEELTQPLLSLADADTEAAVQQQQQDASSVQRFYNPLHYQPLPGKM